MILNADSLIRHVETALTLPLCLLAALIVHEVGHYLAARAQGLRVESVTLGIGRRIWSGTDRHGTLWTLNLWPLRAHVHIRDFGSASLPFRKKCGVILAGPAANFLLPFVLFFLFFATFGVPSIPTVVTAVDIGLPAYEAGLRPGDRITSIEGESVRNMDDILAYTQPRPDGPLRVGFRRNGVAFETSVTPVWAEYRDISGVLRAHGRIGLTTWQQAYSLEAVRSVAGLPTPTEAEARAALLDHLGQRVVIGLWSTDRRIYNSLVDLSAQSNRNLADPGHRDYGRVYLGAMRDNFYMPLSINRTAGEAIAVSGEMLGHVLRLPFNLFPIDREWITPDAVVSRETSYFQVRLYVFVYFASLCSCFIGFLNLLPFPRLDGGEALLLMGEKWKRRPLARREQATLLVFGLLVFYAAVFGLNMTDLRGYYLFQMQKAQAGGAAFQTSE